MLLLKKLFGRPVRFILIFVMSSLYSCTKSEINDIDIYTNYILFSLNPKDVEQNIINLSTSEGYNKKILLFEPKIFLNDLIFTTEFELKNNSQVVIEAGKTDGYMRISNSRIELYKLSPNNTLELTYSFQLSSSLMTGEKFTIGFHKKIDGVSFFFKGGGTDFELWIDIDKDYMQTRLIGDLYFAVESGNVNVYKSVISSNYRPSPKVLIIGDSFIEGIASAQYGYPINCRWCSQLAKLLSIDNCVIDGCGGITASEDWFQRLELECNWFTPEYAIMSIGTNNYLCVGDYMNYISKAIIMLKEKSITPILVTVTPRYGMMESDSPTIINKWVRESGELFIDVNETVTQFNSPKLWKEGFILPDGIHPTVVGYDAMFERVLLDCPFLLL